MPEIQSSTTAANPHAAASTSRPENIPGTDHADLEAGAAAARQVRWALVINEPLHLQWAFVRKMYCIVALQFCFTAATVAASCFWDPIGRFTASHTKLVTWLFCVTPEAIGGLIAIIPLYIYRDKRPVNLQLLGLVTVCFSVTIGAFCSFSITIGRAVLQYLILIIVAAMGLILYTFVAAMLQFEYTVNSALVVTQLITLAAFLCNQMLFHLTRMVLAALGYYFAAVFWVFATLGTNLVIEHHSFEEHVFAVISLYGSFFRLD
ncbi:unnamed protein product [Urochloa humidicola]